MSFSLWERGILIRGVGAFSLISIRSKFPKWFVCLFLVFLNFCAVCSPLLAEKIAYSTSSFDNLDGEANRRLLSFDGLSSSIEVYRNDASRKKIIFLPDPYERLNKRLAESLKKIFQVYLFPDRMGRKKDIRYLSGIYKNYLTYYQTKFSIYRRRTSKLKSRYLWDFIQVNDFLSKNENSFVILTNFSLKHLLAFPTNQKVFKKVIIISPDIKFLEEDFSKFLLNPQILWVDSSLQSGLIKKFQEKYDGEALSYERSGRGIPLFFRNSKALSDVTKWILAN